tara:strand:- start:4731 stop:4859 length:129 start_codon:yes stop_codon:yes gene_type:complete
MNFLKKLLKEKKKIQKMNPSLLKSYALWDIDNDIKEYYKNIL